MTRRDWLFPALACIITHLRYRALGFLARAPEEVFGTDPEGFTPFGNLISVKECWLTTVLMHKDIPSALEEVDGIFDFATSKPDEFYVCSERALEIDIDPREAALSAHTLVDLRITDEDCGHITYFFAYLKSLRSVLLDAQRIQKAVIHVRQTFLYRKQK